ncbi:MAG: tRNA lysidine(34) synthetase TilS [Robiginitomaculum sp.]
MPAKLALLDINKLAIGFSGGGDSTALLSRVLKHTTIETKIHVLIVDHALREGSASEAKLAARRADAMGKSRVKAQILTWRGQKPKTAIQEKARLARYDLLGSACRKLGIEMLLLGHNEDDQAETILMREEGGSTWRGLAGMTAQSYAPIWPELYKITLVRPLLGINRQTIRDYNQEQGLAYSNDPSNENRDFTRIRTRDKLANNSSLKMSALKTAKQSRAKLTKEKQAIFEIFKSSVDVSNWGGIYLAKNVLGETACASVLRILLLAASGQRYFTPPDKLATLAKRMHTPEFSGATLGGAQIINEEKQFLIIRDPGKVLGRNESLAIAPLCLDPGAEQIWDGRFLVKTALANIQINPFSACVRPLLKEKLAGLSCVPYAARITMPVFTQNNVFMCAEFANFHKPHMDFSVKCLISERIKALML